MIDLDFLHGLFDALPDAMVLLRVEEDGQFRYERASRFAYTSGSFSVRHIGKLVVEAHPPEYASYLQEKYIYAAESKNPVLFSDVVHLRGESVVQEAVVTPVLDGLGNCLYLIAEISKEMDGATAQRVQATRKIFESFFDNTGERVVMVRHGDHQIEITDTVLRNAMTNEQLFAEYQPLVSPQSNLVRGVEALIRWNHPNFGHLPPLAFVPAAEQLDCLVEIDLWMMYRACIAIKRSNLSSVHLGVNISTQHLRRKGFIDDVKVVLEETGFPAENLMLEITETALMDRLDLSLEILDALCLMGIKIAIDDFGTGYSSLSYLKDLPVHALKIDRSFVSSVQHCTKSRAIVKAISHLARELGLQVIAEGVETDEQLRFVSNHSDLVQGYIYSRPVTLAQIARQFTA